MNRSGRGHFHLRLASLLILTTLLTGSAVAQRGAVTAARSLDQLSAEAATIVRGQVISARVEPHPQFKNLTTAVITMRVEETLKGVPAKTLQFRQYIWDLRDRLDKARYAKGEELLLMLGPVSKYGLTSPVGLEQGRFRIVRDAQGNALAVNGRGNAGLFVNSAARAQAQGLKLSPSAATVLQSRKAGPVRLDALEDAVRAFARLDARPIQ